MMLFFIALIAGKMRQFLVVQSNIPALKFKKHFMEIVL